MELAWRAPIRVAERSGTSEANVSESPLKPASRKSVTPRPEAPSPRPRPPAPYASRQSTRREAAASLPTSVRRRLSCEERNVAERPLKPVPVKSSATHPSGTSTELAWRAPTRVPERSRTSVANVSEFPLKPASRKSVTPRDPAPHGVAPAAARPPVQATRTEATPRGPCRVVERSSTRPVTSTLAPR